MHGIAKWRPLPTSLRARLVNRGAPCGALRNEQLVRRGASEDFQRKVDARSPDGAVRVPRSARRPAAPFSWSRAAAPRSRRSSAGATRPDDEDVQEVVVTGLRKSIQDSIDVKKDEIVDRRGRVGRRHRQAAGCLHRRSHWPAARHRRAAHQRSRADAVDPRPRSRLHRHHLQRPRAGVDQRQPHGGVRPVPVGARDAGQDLQDARCRHGVPGHRGHDGYRDRASAGLLRSQTGVRLQARDGRAERQHSRVCRTRAIA